MFDVSNKKQFGVTTYFLVAFISIVSMQGWATPTLKGVTDSEILIGQSCQLTGPLAALTTEVRRGASLYLDRVNASGGVGGRKIRIIALDDGYDAKRAAENARALIVENEVLALFQFAGTPTSMAALPLVEEYRVPFIAPFTGSDALRQKFSKYVFNIKAGYAAELDAMVKLQAFVGMNSVAVVYLNNAFGTSGLAVVEQAAKAHKVDLSAQATLEVDGSKMKETVDKIARVAPQAVIVVSAGQPSIDFVNAYLTAGHHSTFFMLSVISNTQILKTLGLRARGVVVSQVVPSPWDQSISVVKEYRAAALEQGISELTFGQMEGFISAKFLVEGLKRAGKNLTRESLIRGLESMARVDLGGYVVKLSEAKHSSGELVDLLIIGPEGRFIK